MGEPRPATIYVVDDDPATRECLVELISLMGLEVRAFARGLDLLRAALADPPELVLCDVLLDDFDGFRLCRSLRSGAAPLEIPVVLLSGLTRPVDVERAAAAGACAYLSKPVDPEQLGRVLARLLAALPAVALAAACD
jgi:CheY-like chemotaxis protein